MSNNITRYYHSLNDLVCTAFHQATYPMGYRLGVAEAAYSFQNLLTQLSYGSTLITGNLIDEKVNTLWYKYIAGLHKSDCITYWDADDDTNYTDAQLDVILRELYTDWMDRFIAKVNNTFERYSTIIDTYVSEKTKLLNKLSTSVTTSGTGTQTSTGSNRFNDTPQNTGDFSTDAHSSTYTQNDGSNTNNNSSTSTTSYDTLTTMAKLKQIEDNWNDIYVEWSNEFDTLFMED